MNVALVCEQIDPARGGAETSTLQFARRLQELGAAVTLYTRPLPQQDAGVPTRSVAAAPWPKSFSSAAFARRVEDVLKAAGHDLVHAVTPCRCADVYQPRGGAMPESVARNLALRHSFAGRLAKHLANLVNLRQWSLLWLERRMLRQPRPPWIIAISDYVARQMRQHYGVPDSRITRVMNGVDCPPGGEERRAPDRGAVRRRYQVADQQVLVLLVAHNFRLKGVGEWISACARLHRGEPGRFRSLIVGRGPEAAYRRQLRRLGMEGVVTFTGPAPDIMPYLHAADVLVHPTYYDPCSRVVLEAMVSALPCVTTRFNGAAEVIRHGVDGIVLDAPGDIDALAAAVRQASHESFSHALRARRSELAETLSMRRHAREVLRVYEHVLAERRR